jgi:hypothetical protein
VRTGQHSIWPGLPRLVDPCLQHRGHLPVTAAWPCASTQPRATSWSARPVPGRTSPQSGHRSKQQPTW